MMKFVHTGYFTLGQATPTAADPGKERDITEIKIVSLDINKKKMVVFVECRCINYILILWQVCITVRVVCILDLQVIFIYK
jgi:hypothetical protein